MGSNDDREMLEAAKAEVARLEVELTIAYDLLEETRAPVGVTESPASQVRRALELLNFPAESVNYHEEHEAVEARFVWKGLPMFPLDAPLYAGIWISTERIEHVVDLSSFVEVEVEHLRKDLAKYIQTKIEKDGWYHHG